MNKLSGIDEKWVKEESRTFSIYPGLPKQAKETSVLGEEETWLELAQFVKDDLLWLLSLDHQKFWSHMIYCPNAHKLLVSFLKQAPPHYLRKEFLPSGDIENVFKDIERLEFLVFLRLTVEREKESVVKNLGEILYNNYLFTVPIILDICSIYGVSNQNLVKKLLDRILTLAPDFLEDFLEIPPNFLQVFKVVQKKLLVEQAPRLKIQTGLNLNEVRDLIFYLYDTVSTVQLFLELCPKAREMFCRCEFVSEVVAFYSNVLPEVEEGSKDNQQLVDLIENCRVDLLKIVKSIFDYLSDDPEKIGKSKEEAVDEYMTLMSELLSEPLFLTDFNILYSVEFEIQSLIQDCANVDAIKLNHILEGVSIAAQTEKKEKARDSQSDAVRLNSLITEVKDILPHLDEPFIKECLKYYDYNTERVIAAVLENSVPSCVSSEPAETKPVERKGNHKVPDDLENILDDRRDVKEIKERYAEFEFVADDTYDDEYDDTYDENIDVTEADDLERQRRPFVVPRVLRPPEEAEESEEEEEEVEEPVRKDWFVQNPAEIRERNARLREERQRRDVVGRAKGQGQNKEVLRNREFKGANKSFMGNHNRKKQASRKMHQGMIPS